MKFLNPTLRMILMGFAMIAVIVLAVPAAMTFAEFSRITEWLSGARASFQIIRTADSIQQALVAMELASRNHQEGKQGVDSDQYRTAEKKARSGFQELKQLLSENPEQQKHVLAADELLTQWQTRMTDLTQGSQEKAQDSTGRHPGDSSPARALDSVSLASVWTHLLSATEAQMAISDSHLASAADKLASRRVPAYIGMAVYAMLLLLAAFLLARHITRPLAEAVTFAEAIRRGELSQRVDLSGLKEAKTLGACLNAMAEGLNDYNRRVREGVDVLTGSVAQIAGTASEVLTSASQTASAVTETTAIVNEMERGAKVVNETARRVAEHSEHADDIANKGTKATSDTLQKMNLIKEKMGIVNEAVIGLNDKTKFVEAIIGAVQDLTDQSNLLAVNASIEAARAGEHGKGFAVVASEIKSLADQSREATKRVTSTLQEIRKSVGAVVMATEEGGKAVSSGVEQSEAAGESIQKLAGSIGEFSQAAGVIFASSGKQFSRVERIAAAMRNVELAMNNSVEGTTHVENEAKRLEQLAQSLMGLVRHYKADEPDV